ncbi:MAG: zinc-dependent peptidase, partial [Ginsengibacter sp.]
MKEIKRQILNAFQNEILTTIKIVSFKFEPMAPVIILVFLTCIVLFAIFYKKPPKKIELPANYRDLLTNHVAFYSRLSNKNKKLFEEKLKEFLGYVQIESVHTEVEDIDQLLVASSAVIPVFYFPSYKYFNLKSVILYPGTFNREEFLTNGYERNTLGMVGTGPLQGSMILSKAALHHGFFQRDQPHNTGIHEFVHLMDKEDGEVDGLPESLLNKNDKQKWLMLVNENIRKIHDGESDISSYATT